MANKLTARQERCAECADMKIKGTKWTCNECFGQFCDDIDDCPNGITLAEIDAIEEKTKDVKISVGARSETKKERQPRERKPDEEKETIIADVADFLINFAELNAKNVKITNVSKVIEFDIGDNHYKLDLIRQRKPKN